MSLDDFGRAAVRHPPPHAQRQTHAHRRRRLRRIESLFGGRMPELLGFPMFSWPSKRVADRESDVVLTLQRNRL